MRFLDWAVVVAYLVYVIWDGIRMTKHSGSAEGYFLANRSLPWWAVGLSVMATQLSAITLVGGTLAVVPLAMVRIGWLSARR